MFPAARRNRLTWSAMSDAARTPDPGSRTPSLLADAGRRLGAEPHLNAVRDGVVGALPLILLGSLFLLLAQPPLAALRPWAERHREALLAPYRMLTGLLAVYAGFGAATSLAKRRGTDPLAGALLGLACYFLAIGPARLAPSGWGLDGAKLGAGGLFAALLFGMFAVEVQSFFAKRDWTVKLPGGAPEAVVRSFAALAPSAAAVGLVVLVVYGLHVDVVALIAAALRPLVRAGDSVFALWLIVLIDSGLWLVGVHAFSVLAPVRALWAAALVENGNAIAAGALPAHLGTQEFFVWFVWQGGSGATLALALLLVRARSRALRDVGRIGLVPALFNVNEPLLFGVPVVLNGTLAIPMLAAPIASVATAWAAMRAGLVSVPYVEVLWTMPAPVGAWLTTGGDWRAVVLQLGNLALSTLIWWPFLRAYDRKLAAAEALA